MRRAFISKNVITVPNPNRYLKGFKIQADPCVGRIRPGSFRSSSVSGTSCHGVIQRSAAFIARRKGITLALAGFAASHHPIELRRLMAWDAKAAPVGVLQMFGEKYDLPS